MVKSVTYIWGHTVQGGGTVKTGLTLLNVLCDKKNLTFVLIAYRFYGTSLLHVY